MARRKIVYLFKVGQKVIVNTPPINYDDPPGWDNDMDYLCGRTCAISRRYPPDMDSNICMYTLAEDRHWLFSEDWLRAISDKRKKGKKIGTIYG